MKRIANFCPNCGTAFVHKQYHGQVRPVCPACEFVMYHDPKVAVVVVVLRDDAVLLVKRANEPGQGLWACPAGFVDYNEAPYDAAIRETQEETGLIIQIDRVLEVYGRKDAGLANIAICYQASVVGGDLNAGDDAEDARWFKRDTLPPLVFYPSVMLVGIRWRQGRL